MDEHTGTKMPKTARAMLDLIDNFLAQRDQEAGKLWDVLTALRGPDNELAGEEKFTTTVHIRAAAFPKTAKKRYSSSHPVYPLNGAFFSDYRADERPFLVPDENSAAGAHFRLHIMAAAEALDLQKA